MPHPESPHDTILLEEEPDDARRAVAKTYLAYGDTAPQTTLPWREHLAAGDTAYMAAMERQRVHGLDSKAVELYEQASSHLLSAAFLGPDRTIDPREELKIASSLGWQAQATQPGIFYEDYGSRHVDKKTNLQEIAHKTHQHAVVMLLGKASRTAAQTGEVLDIDPSEVAEAAVEAAKEAGTDEHVTVRGIGRVTPETTHRLETEGKEAILRFIGEHAMDPGHGGEFTALMAEKEVTGIHELPLAA